MLDGDGDFTPKADESVRQSSVTEEEKIPGEPLAIQEVKKKEDEESLQSVQSVPFCKLFSFADYIDILLMIIGTVPSLASGVGMSLMTLLFGQLVNAFRETANTNNVVHKVSKVKMFAELVLIIICLIYRTRLVRARVPFICIVELKI